MKRVILVEFEDEIEDRLVEMVETDLDYLDARITAVEVGDVFGDMPDIVKKYMVFDLDGEFSLDFEAVFGLMEYVYDKPVTVCQTLLKLLAAIRNLHQQYYEVYNEAKEEFDTYTAEKTAFLSSDKCDIEFKKTAANIEAHVKSDSQWRLKKAKVVEAEQIKARLYNAKDLVEKAYSTCDAFVKNGKNVVLENKQRDRTFREVTSAVIEDAVRLEEAID